MSKGIVISGFAGIGKTNFSKENSNSIDLESGIFQYNIDPKLNYEKQKGSLNRQIDPNWLENYVKAIKQAKEKFDYIFIAQFPELLNELLKQNIDFIIVCPNKSLKNEYKKRFEQRGNQKIWIDKMLKNWDVFISGNKNFAEQNNIKYIELKENQYIKDAVKIIDDFNKKPEFAVYDKLAKTLYECDFGEHYKVILKVLKKEYKAKFSKMDQKQKDEFITNNFELIGSTYTMDWYSYDISKSPIFK